jgi:hypothetical protein
MSPCSCSNIEFSNIFNALVRRSANNVQPFVHLFCHNVQYVLFAKPLYFLSWLIEGTR